MNRPEQAVSYARKAVASSPDSAWARSTLLEALIQARREAEALREARAALVVAPDDPSIHKLAGVAAYQAGRFKEAREHLERSVELWPEDPGAHAVLGKALAHLRKKPQALGHATRAVSLAPEDAFAHRAQGDVYLEFKDWQNAKACYRRSLELDPEDTYTHTNLGYALQESGDRDAALEHTITAARLDPTNKVATSNVVGIGRSAIAGGGVAIYLAVRFGSVAWRHEGFRLFGLVALAVVAAAYFGYRRLQERDLPKVVQEAIRSQRRLDGPLPTPVWVLAAVVGSTFAGGALGRFVDGDTSDPTRDRTLLVAGFVLVLASAYFIRRRAKQRDLAEVLSGSFPLWACLAAAVTLLSAWYLVQALVPTPALPSRGEAVQAFTTASSIAALLGFVAFGKRPGRAATE